MISYHCGASEIVFAVTFKNFWHLRLFLIIMEDEGSNVFKLVQTNSAFYFLKNNTSSANAKRVLFFIESKASCFNYYLYLKTLIR